MPPKIVCLTCSILVVSSIVKFTALHETILCVRSPPHLLTIPAPEIQSIVAARGYLFPTCSLYFFFKAFQSWVQVIFLFSILLYTCHDFFGAFTSEGLCHLFPLVSVTPSHLCSSPVNTGLCLTAGFLPVVLIIDHWTVSDVYTLSLVVFFL